MSEIKEMQEDLKKYKELSLLKENKGVIIILDSFKESIASEITELITNNKEKSEAELRASLSRLEGFIMTIRALNNAEKQVDDLEAIIKKELKDNIE